MSASNDDAETVDAFLERIASLKDRRNREDEERTRKIEEEILQGRRERRARRAEQARSLSAPKSSEHATSPSSVNSPHHDLNIEPAIESLVRLSPVARSHSMEHSTQSEAIKDFAQEHAQRPLSTSSTKTGALSNTTAAILGRSGALSWQQRPSSRGSETTRSRPLSQHADEVASAATNSNDESRTRDQIALSLSSKDPFWFRQTADRGVNSSAYRKTREENNMSLGQRSRQLPGLSRESSTEPEKAPFSAPLDRSRSPSQVSSIVDTGSWSHRFSSISSHSTFGGPKSPLPTISPQKFGPSVEDSEHEQSGAKRTGNSSLTGQVSRDRSASPTKGLGGFVQSAMMKRSDSVNKRWSAQATPRLSRGNSITSYRGGLGKLGSAVPGPASPPRDTQAPSEGGASSPSARSRPTSSHSTSTVLHHPQPSHRSSFPSPSPNEITLPSLDSGLAQNTSPTETGSTEQHSKPKFPTSQSTEALPTSPTQTMNPKRWSPTKASWLESALSRPESPSLTSPKSQTPSWMADLRKSKLSKEDSDSIKGPSSGFTVVSPTGLMRSPPPGGQSRPLSISGLPEGFHSGATRKVSPEKPRHAVVEESPATPGEVPKQDDPSSTSTQEPPTSHPLSPSTIAMSNSAEKSSSESASKSDGKKPSPSPKLRPQTPPKTDFRANLRPRQKLLEESSSTEPEFKNVFGKLKRTETKNYVAPDELKGNIMRGKAALNTTGGSQKAKRVDEFKESILKKKESMKAGTSFQQKSLTGASGTDSPPQTIKTLPEALAKRNALNQSTGFSRASSTNAEPTLLPKSPSSGPVKAAEESVLSQKDQPPPSTEKAQPLGGNDEKQSNQRMPTPQEERPKLSAEQGFSKSSGATQSTSSSTLANGHLSSGKQPMSLPRVTNKPERSKDIRITGKLVDRLNPGLAGILSRGPTPATTSISSSKEDVTGTGDAKPPSKADKSGEPPAGELTHMTKARAKGPKRRLPKTASSVVGALDTASQPLQSEVHISILQDTPPENLSNQSVARGFRQEDENGNTDSVPTTPTNVVIKHDEMAQANMSENKPVLPMTDDEDIQKPATAQLADTTIKEKARPVVAAKSPALKKVSSPPPGKSVSLPPKSDTKPNGRPEQEKIGEAAASFPRSIEALPSKNPVSASSSLRWNNGESLQQDIRIPLTKNEFKAAPASRRKPTLSGLGLKLESEHVRLPNSQLTPPPEEKPASALCFQKTTAQPQTKESSKTNISTGLRQNSVAAQLMNDFFDEKPRLADKAEVDAQAVIQTRPSVDSKRKVLKTQVWRITADGKKEDGLPNQEHVLFEDSMHLCVHSFEKSPGVAAAEVYLWSGDGVGEAAIEDAQLFCRREARENNAKLELFRQGKEPAKFFQALGGIVVTRRSRNSALYMLCGRRHLGHIAFDEVDLDAASLCSEFPYIISARFGKLYLWKGKGSGADEVGCARLIGMDLGLTGEIEEVEEGAEPSSFFESFAGAVKPRIPSQQWSLKSRYDHHGCRLFRIELDQSKGMAGFWTRRGSSPTKPSRAIAQEIHPFCQKDLDPRCIFVLDAYSTVFVYIGVEAGSKTREFITALMFAHEYGILAASLEDRPLVPTCKITFQGAPPDFAAAFRKWESPSGVKSQQQQSGQVIALNEALEALSSENTRN